MTTTVQRPDLLVSPVCNQCGGFRIFAEEVLTNVGTVFGFEGLVVTVNGFTFISWISLPLVSLRSSSSQREPHITLITFQPAPAKMPSSSLMILPLPVTGPSRRCRLQLMMKHRLSSFSRVAMVIAP